jgi:hypothetical protein
MDDGSGWTVSGLSCVLYLNHQKKNSSKLEIHPHWPLVGSMVLRSAGPAQKARYDLSKIYDLHDVNIFHISDHFIPELHQSKALSESYPKPCSKVS